MFNEKLSDRAKQSGWMKAGADIMMITYYTGTPINLITEYGILKMENIEENIKNFIGQRSFKSQN